MQNSYGSEGTASANMKQQRDKAVLLTIKMK